MKKIPEMKARMVRWGRMCPTLLRTKPMNKKKRLTRGKGVAERIISGTGEAGKERMTHFSRFIWWFVYSVNSVNSSQIKSIVTSLLVFCEALKLSQINVSSNH
jgi:hypothetical protein